MSKIAIAKLQHELKEYVRERDFLNTLIREIRAEIRKAEK